MTIEELKARWPWIITEEYVQHENGGGWKHKTAIVPADVKVPPSASIGYRASIGNGVSIGADTSIGAGVSVGNRTSLGYRVSLGAGASVGNRASLGDGASIGDDSSIGYRASIGAMVSIGERVSIGARASIGASAFVWHGAFIGPESSIGERASIGDDSSIADGHTGPILCIRASAHQITTCRPGRDVQIGCERHSIDWWLSHFEKVGAEAAYKPEQIAEYGALLQTVAAWLEQYAPKPVEATGGQVVRLEVTSE